MTLDLMNKIISLCKRRGFVFQSSEIYGGLKSCYDYGPLGAELKRNIAAQWWNHMVHTRDDIVGIDASIMMHTDVWKASGHLKNFTDPLVDCLNCQERFRGDKAPKIEPGTVVKFRVGGKKGGESKEAAVASCGYVCPSCSSPLLSDERLFRCMFRTTMGPIDPVGDLVKELHGSDMDRESFFKKATEVFDRNSVYLRPETAQAMFVQFNNVQQSMSLKIPFGIAQKGKSFRNEIIVEHFIFRSCEFEQMEMEYFCEPGSQKDWMKYWTNARLEWHRSFSQNPENFRLRAHSSKELAHYSDECYDIEFLYPWGWDELEGIASRTDYDLKQHAQASGAKLQYFDPNKGDPETGKMGWRYTPYVVEPALGLTRMFLAVLLDSYCEESSQSSSEEEGSKTRIFLRLHPKLAPIKGAFLPLVKKDGLDEIAKEMTQEMRKKTGLFIKYDDTASIGKRYARHDEIGTPYCFTIDQQTKQDGTITLRDRDTAKQERVSLKEAIDRIIETCR